MRATDTRRTPLVAGVAEGYKTQRFLPLDASRTTTQDDLNVNYFRSDVDTLRAVFSSSSRGLQRFCDAGDAPSWSRQPDDGVADPSARTSRKRSAKGMEDDDDDTPKASDEDGDVAMPLGQVTVNDRTVKGTPKRFMRATQSLPVGRFAFSGGPVASVGVGAFSAAPHGQSGFGTFPTAVDTVARDGVPDFGEFFDKDDF